MGPGDHMWHMKLFNLGRQTNYVKGEYTQQKYKTHKLEVVNKNSRDICSNSSCNNLWNDLFCSNPIVEHHLATPIGYHLRLSISTHRCHGALQAEWWPMPVTSTQTLNK